MTYTSEFLKAYANALSHLEGRGCSHLGGACGYAHAMYCNWHSLPKKGTPFQGRAIVMAARDAGLIRISRKGNRRVTAILKG